MVGEKGSIKPVLKFEKDAIITTEKYLLDINTQGICFRFNDAAGAFHAVTTIKQLIDHYLNTLPCIQIMDEPDFKVRGSTTRYR